MKLKILCETPELAETYRNHSHFHEGDSGLDIFLPVLTVVEAKKKGYIIPLGIKVEPSTSFMLVPRSSMGVKTPLRMSNSIGIIDKGYRGTLGLIVDNLANTIVLDKGTRLCQIIAPNLESIEVEVVDSLTATTRGENGYGSTGE